MFNKALLLVFSLQSCLIISIYGQYRDGDIRLVGGSYQWEGRVEIYFSGIWGTITDSEWSTDDAQVVCRKLGYFKPGASGQSDAYFGEGSGPMHLDYVACSGGEYNLTDCETGNTSQTSHTQDVGVKCQTIDTSYREGDIRLVEGRYNWEGRVEIYISGTWSTIYDSSWTNSDTEVVCRQLGHSTQGAVAWCCAHYGQGSGNVLVRQVSCSGSESYITSCSYSTYTGTSHTSDVGVQCQTASDYREGDIRLVGGSYSWEGRVEIYLYGVWGTITDYFSNYYEAQVVCRQLGYDIRYGYTDVSRSYAYFGEGTGPIHMNYLVCSGTEYRLKDCNYYNSTYDHNEDWSIICQNDGPQSGEVRLYYSYSTPNYYSGRVEVYLSEEWGTVSDDSWSLEDGEVVCRQLGHDIPSSAIRLYAGYYYFFFYYPSPSRPIHLSNVQCSGSESRLIDCPHSSGGNGSDAELTCYYGNCRVGELRLVGGETEMEGRVVVCGGSYYTWGTVCGTQWTAAHTKVVCRNLGFSDSEGSFHESDVFGEGAIPILMDYVNCSGSEFTLWDCPHFTHTYGCNHSDDVGVRCQPAQCEDGELTLVEEESERKGQVKLCFNQRWGTACSSGYEESDVVCRQLGYSETYRYYGRSALLKILIEVSCFGTEFRLLDCSYSNDTSGCSYSQYIECNPAVCADGEVRLVEGESEWEGRLEVCLSQRWGTISSDGWSQTNTQVICSDLGYDPISEYTPRPALSKPIYMGNVHCSDRALTLLDCSYDTNTSLSDHSKDIGILCKDASCNDGDVRVVGGDSEREGRLEVCFNQRWGTVNGDGWSSVDTQVACRQLGYETSDISFSLSGHLHKNAISSPIHIDNVACYGAEAKLIDCSYHTDTAEDDHSEDIWVRCLNIEHCSLNKDTTVSQQRSSSSALSAVALTMALAICMVVVTVVVVYVVLRHIKKRKNQHSNESTFIGNTGGNNRTIDSHTHTTVDNTDTLGGRSQPLSYEVVSIARERDEPKTHYQTISGATLQQNGPYQTRSDWGTANNEGGGNKSENKKQCRSKLPLPCEPVSTARHSDEPKVLYQSLSVATLQRGGPYQTRSDWGMPQNKGGGDKSENKKQRRSKLPQVSARNAMSPNTDCGMEDASGVMEGGIYESCT